MLFLLALVSLFQFFTIHTQASEALNLFGKNMSSTSAASSAKSRLVYGKDDSLFGLIEEKQGKTPFGNFLDAGTG